MIEALQTYLFRYTDFVRHYIVMDPSDRQRTLQLWVIWLSGISLSLGLIESSSFGTYGYPDSYRNWAHLWVIVLPLGLLVGLVGYVVRGFIFHFAVRLAGGTASNRVSRKVLLYAGLPLYVITVLSECLNMLVYGNRYFTADSELPLDFPLTIIKAGVMLYFIVLLYKGVRLACLSAPLRTCAFIIAVPLLLNAAAVMGKVSFTQAWSELYKFIPLYF
jgi:hypothetical protein